MRPSMKASGTNATHVVSTAATTGAPTSPAPFSAAMRGGLPCLSFVKMFSPITIASSTMRPSTMMRPKRDMRLMLAPATSISTKVPANETASPMVTQKATRISRKIASVITTRIRPIVALRFMRSRRCSMNRARSVETLTFKAPPALSGSSAT